MAGGLTKWTSQATLKHALTGYLTFESFQWIMRPILEISSKSIFSSRINCL